MSHAQAPLRFATLDEFDAWEDGQPGKWELHDGVPVLMSPERVDHIRIKYQVWEELRRALHEAGSPCEVLGDGLTVPGPGLRSFRPDVTVMCGARLGGDETKGRTPTVLVEVLSPSTAKADTGIKLESYFALPSVQYYLLVGSLECRVIVYARGRDGRPEASRAIAGVVRLDPPGIDVSIDAFYEGTDLARPTG